MSAGWTVGAGRPTVVQPSAYTAGGSEAGIDCGCCTVCPCIFLGFLKTKSGWLKMIELLLTAITLVLVLNYGLPYSESIGNAFDFFLVVVVAGIFVVSLLVFCYIISANSFSLIRSSVLEAVFNTLICILYFISSSHLSWSVQERLYPHYKTTPHFSVYPAMTAAYVFGFVLGIVHLIDTFFAFRFLRSGRS